MTDPISDMFIRIKNAQMVSHGQVSMPFSKMKYAIAMVLKDLGYIGEIERKKKKAKKAEHDYLVLNLKYDEGRPAVQDVKMLSTPARRMYIKASEIRPIRSGFGMAIISTPQGIMSSKEARKQKLGGEIICNIW